MSRYITLRIVKIIASDWEGEITIENLTCTQIKFYCGRKTLSFKKRFVLFFVSMCNYCNVLNNT